jgi:hypothetical protein
VTKDELEVARDLWDKLGVWFGVGVFLFIGLEVAAHFVYRRYSRQYEEVLKADERHAQRQLTYALNKAGARFLDTDRFKAALNGKPKGSAQIWYKRDDAEAYSFAQQIHGNLRAAGWEASGPAPIPLTGGDPGFSPDVPSEIRYGGAGGVDVFLRAPIPDMSKRDNTFVTLQTALIQGRTGPIGSGASISLGDPKLSEGHFIIIVGQKQ